MSLRSLVLFISLCFALGPFVPAIGAWVQSGSAEDILTSYRRSPASKDPYLCQKIETFNELHRQLDFDDFDWTSAAADSLMKSLTENPVICVSKSSFSDDLAPIAERLCPLIRRYASESPTIDELRARVRTAYLQLDGTFLISKHPIGRLAQICKTDDRTEGIYEVLGSLRNTRCPTYWSPARCARVLHYLEVSMLRSWDF